MEKFQTANDFLNRTLNKSYDMDGYFGCQCWDYLDYFWVNQVGRIFNTAGTGCVRDSFNGANAGSQFDMITDKNALKVGDFVIFSGGLYGHCGIIREITQKGKYIKLQGQNQPHPYVNVIAFDLTDFVGAFRYKEWVEEQPKKLTNEQVADEVIKGLWGNGQDRVNKLTNAGYDYNAVQSIVNWRCSQKKSDEEIANEVIRGLWGNGSERKQRLTDCGYNYDNIQSIVNRKMS